MAHAHHHHHHHHGPHDDAHEAPLDAANQSLADALKASFGILKLIMFVLVIMYCFSGVQCIEQNEEAVVLRFGKLLPDPRPAGLSWAFPYPIDETIIVPTQKDNELLVKHWPQIRPGQEGQPLNKVRAGGGLNPAVDGALLTADKGMVHMQWSLLYRITDLRDYVLYVADDQSEDVETLIAGILDNAAIRIVAEYPAEAVTRGETAEVAGRVQRAVNEQLAALNTGLTVVGLDVPKSSVPGQTIIAFDEVTRAENEKQKQIRGAEQKADELLNEAAGEQYRELLARIDAHELALAQGNDAEAARVMAEIDDMLTRSVGGEAGEAVRRANSFYTDVVQQVRGDVDQYRAALDEYLTAKDLFVHRMWKRTEQRVLQHEGVVKYILPSLMDEVRIKYGTDPEQRRLDEIKKLQREGETRDFSTPKKMHAIMPSEE
jgi:membrane protease subunit HflK